MGLFVQIIPHTIEIALFTSSIKFIHFATILTFFGFSNFISVIPFKKKKKKNTNIFMALIQ